ncbi:MAG: acetamidase/formamidase family protein [Firmicutes bacterium]|nr:acetamidase/formamidase family protein [Bacillota bacterium]
MSMTLSAEHLIYAMSANHPPALHVPDGATIRVETCDCFENQIVRADQDFGSLDWDRINPASGPIFVDGALPGDQLLIEILAIEVADHGVMTTGPGLGVLGDELAQNAIRIVPIVAGQVHLSDTVHVPVQPMIGVIGTAPSPDVGPVSCGTPGEHGGNMDCKRIASGATLLLPVNVAGALLALGDLHATMGDGEVAVCGVEVAGSVTVRIRVLKGGAWPVPLVFDDQRVSTIASAKLLDDAATSAVHRMVRLLETECGLDTASASFILTAAGDLRVCQVVDPLKTARMELPLTVARQLGLTLP